MPDVYAVAAVYRDEMLALDRKAARRIADQYRGAYSELQRRMKWATDELERLRADPNATPLEIDKALFKSDRWRQAYNEARDELQRFNAVAKGITQDAQGEAIDLGAEHMDGLMRAAISGNRGDARGPLGIDYSFAKPDTQAMSAMIGFASNGGPLANLFTSIAPESLDLARGVLARGVALGTSPVVIGKQLAGPLGLPAWRGLTIARTETLRAYREAQRQTIMANDDVLEGWIWHSARDRRTCEVCWSMDGRLFTVVAGLTDTAGHQSVPGDAVKATDYLEGHVNCRCTLIPRPKSYGDILGDPSLPDERPAVTTGAEEFAKLSPGQQASILGPGKFALFQMGVPLEAFVNRVESSAWGASRVAKPLFQLAEELKAGGWSGGSIPPGLTDAHDASRILPPAPLDDAIHTWVTPGEDYAIRKAASDIANGQPAAGRAAERARAIMAAINRAPVLPETLWRGEQLYHVPEVGSVIRRPLSSWSLTRAIGEGYAENPAGGALYGAGQTGHQVLFRLYGAKAVAVPDMEEYASGGSFEVVSIARGEPTVVTLRQVKTYVVL